MSCDSMLSNLWEIRLRKFLLTWVPSHVLLIVLLLTNSLRILPRHHDDTGDPWKLLCPVGPAERVTGMTPSPLKQR